MAKTIAEIDKEIEELKQKKLKALQKQKQQELREKRLQAARRRKLENRVKYIIGGWVLSHQAGKGIDVILKDPKTRDQDRKTLEAFKASLALSSKPTASGARKSTPAAAAPEKKN